jgi:probable HAF family extracellular repeat protein
MQSVMRRCIQIFTVLAAITCSCAVQARYDVAIVDYPNATLTEFFGINDSGQVVGDAGFADGSVRGFIYDLNTGVFTDLPPLAGFSYPSAGGINQNGVIVGIADDDISANSVGLILDTNNVYTVFSHPGWDNTFPRGINSSGLVTGYSQQNGPPIYALYTGFIYDTTNNSFVDIFFLGSISTVAQGINDLGVVVGSANLPRGGAYGNSPPGDYGFLRDANGGIALFRMSNSQNWSRARGITNAGRVTGTVSDRNGNHDQGYVVDLVVHPGFQVVNLTRAEIFSAPGATDTIPQAIDDLGRIVGIAYNADESQHGFIATPHKNGRR